MNDILYLIFEADAKEITWWAMCFRGIIVFFLAIVMIKIGGRRMFGRQAAFDIVISITMGALLAKAIAGNAKFIPIIISTFLLVVLYRLLARATFNYDHLGKLIKGDADILIKDGKVITYAMRKNNITEKDILEAARTAGKKLSISKIKEAYLEEVERLVLYFLTKFFKFFQSISKVTLTCEICLPLLQQLPLYSQIKVFFHFCYI